MANYYINFSLEFNITDEERKWLDTQLSSETPEFEIDDDSEHWPDFQWGLQSDTIWIHSDGESNLEQVIDLCSGLLNHFDSNKKIGFEWSLDCSKPRTDAYGGGAVCISKDKVVSMNTGSWLNTELNKTQEPKKSRKGEK